MSTILVARHVQKRAMPKTVSKTEEYPDFLLSLFHILIFYTLLLASVRWYEKYLSWMFQLTSWVLLGNCCFYAALLYVNNAKNPFLILKKKTAMRILSELFTIFYVINMSLTYYFLFAVYPKLKGSDYHQQLVTYIYPGLSVWFNCIINFNYTKSLHFRGFGGSVIFVSMYLVIIGGLRHICSGLILTETELDQVAWFDPTNLMGKFQIFIIIMSVNYLGLHFIFHKIFKNNFKQKLRARKLTIEIHH